MSAPVIKIKMLIIKFTCVFIMNKDVKKLFACRRNVTLLGPIRNFHISEAI